MIIVGDPKAVLAQLPPCQLKHPAKLKELRAQWDLGCAKLLAGVALTSEQKVKVVMDWLSKAGVRDFVLGQLLLNFSRPLPVPPTEEQRKSRRQKTLVRLAYNDELPHLRAVNKVVTLRLDGLSGDATGSLSDVDKLDDREAETPGAMFAEFAKSIDAQVVIEYQAATEGEGPFADAAQ